MRQSQGTEQSKFVGSSYHQITYIEKEPKNSERISEGDMITRRNFLLPHTQAHAEFNELRPHTQMLERHRCLLMKYTS